MFAEGFPREADGDHSARATQLNDSLLRQPLQDATRRLQQRFPEFSALPGASRLQAVALAAWLASSGAGLFQLGGAYSWVLVAPLMLPFAGLVFLRLLVLWHALSAPHETINVATRIADHKLPSFTILVPVFREGAVVGQLVRALAALDYPTAKLNILFLAEACDEPTQAALRQAGLAAHMHLVVVPEGAPRTKPRALNFGLGLATGEYVTVYDAEDEPDRDQLRRVQAAFRDGAGHLGCVQCRLKIYNAQDTWLTRQFAIEYAALFDLALPTFDRLGLPITLGGTSNHFPRHVLEELGGWDPYNVTEDADLGLRLARFGRRVAVSSSATWEEAPRRLTDWRYQRMRWQKGWLQTAIVHTRQPGRVWRELGAWRCVALYLMLAGMLLSALVHPIYLVALALVLAFVSDVAAVWWVGLGIFGLGYATSFAIAVIAARRCDHQALARHALLIPVYWLLISAAAYGALWEFAVRPFHWNKTPHAGRRTGCGSGLPAQEVADQP